jgi:hypothetical protein
MAYPFSVAIFSGYPSFVDYNPSASRPDPAAVAGVADHPRLRKSRTRTALPSERGTSPGAFTATAQVTPIIALT